MANVKFNRGKTRANSITAAKTTDGYSTVYFPTDSATIVLGIGSTTDNREYGQAVQDAAGTERAFLLGHAVQGSIATTISNANVYMQEDKLYSNNSEVVNVADAQTISGDKTFAGKIIKSGGTGDQVLAADGSVRAVESAVTTGSDSLVTSGAVDVQIKAIDGRIAALEATGPSMNITWSELKALRDAGSLIPGMQYRITDYQCTTVQENTRSAGHQFDIIVTADDESTLNEVTRAAKHDSDTYFANNDLSVWQIWYCLDNDTTRFEWADMVNGKGVIYRMIDEFDNDVPYDFKNIQFKYPINTDEYPDYYYTFTYSSDNTDCSLSMHDVCRSNTIKEYIITNDFNTAGKRKLNHIVFMGNWYFNNYFGCNCYNNVIRTGSNDNFFVAACNDNCMGPHCQGNYFSPNCSNNTLGEDSYNNTFGTSCSFNHITGSRNNTLGNDCSYNTLSGWCNNNTLGNDCSYNTFGSDCCYNSFGNNCSYIKFASDSSAETKYEYYQNNHFGDGCQYIIFKGAETASNNAQVQNYNFTQGLYGNDDAYLTIDGVRNRAFETKVAQNSNGELKTYCEADLTQ